MPVKHIVLFRFKQGVSKEHIDIVFNKLAKLKQIIPGIMAFQRLKYSSQEGLNQGYTDGFEMIFESERSRDEYLPHLEHIKVAGEIKKILTSFPGGVLAFDSIID